MGIKQAKQSKQVNNQISKQAGSLNAASQRLRPPTVARVYRRSQRGYRCTYDYTNIYRRSHAGNACYYDSNKYFRRSQRGYRCSYDCTEIYRRRLAGYASYLRLYRNLSS